MLTVLRVPHEQQRYDTCGDWTFGDDPNGNLTIRVSMLPTPKYEILVVYHEFIEATLCTFRGITPEAVDAFDTTYEGPFEEPGEDPLAPYHKEHTFASVMERRLCEELGFDWDAYERELANLEWRQDV